MTKEFPTQGNAQMNNSKQFIVEIVGGSVEAGSPDAGNAVKVGGVYRDTEPVLQDGDRGELQLDANSNLITTSADKDANGNLPVTDGTGQNRFDDEPNVRGCNLYVISGTSAVTVGGGTANDTKLIGIQITAALTGTCAITGFGDSVGAAKTITLPAATPAGFKDFCGARNVAGALTVTCSNAADDDLVGVLWEVNTDQE